MKTILFTGGGTPGHVTPNLALIEKFQQEGWQINYAGTAGGIEEKLIRRINIPFYAITSGKLRRYFSWQNFTDPFCILLGVLQAYILCRKLKPHVVFSKGGFVSFPVVVGAWLNRIPIVAHESDFTPGLANKLVFPFANKIALSFAETGRFFKNKMKLFVTGSPLRSALFSGAAEKGRAFCGFNKDKKIIVVMGGGLGSTLLNEAIKGGLPDLLSRFQIVHLCGHGKGGNYKEEPGYKVYEYLHEELFDVLACADIVVSRSGANSVFELLALKKVCLFIPLSTKASRGDQIDNAKYCQDRGLSAVLAEEELSPQNIFNRLCEIEGQYSSYQQALNNYQYLDAITLIYECLSNLQCGEKTANLNCASSRRG
jgi:UDP-N-acetylglucosamine--N-acetylmuramyl-(pentapeptide) pyrophosphoryl-undecaprenol N-acetylglucosamine transferase